jgi:signal transduction histidine kinase
MTRPLLDNRLLLVLGFGGLLCLLPLMSYRANVGLSETELRSDRVRHAYLHRNHLLNDLRSHVLVSGTYLRDYLLDSDSQAAALHLRRLQQSLHDVDELLGRPELSSGGEVYQEFLRQYRDYAASIVPVLSWTHTERQRGGYTFLHKAIFPRRTKMLQLTDQISRWNELQLNNGVLETQNLNLDVRSQLRVQVLLLLGFGVCLAAFLYFRITSLEMQASKRFEEAELARAESKRLAIQLVSAQEDERKRISRELHDEVGQSLSAQRLALHRLSAKLPVEILEKIADDLSDLNTLTDANIKTTRNLSLLLRPSMLDDLGLLAALNWMARECTRRCDAKVFIDASDGLDNLNEAHNTCLYRVVQESLNNALNHGKATEIRIKLLWRDSRLTLSVQDNGNGFDVQPNRGMGILGMTERVEQLGGRLQIKSEAMVGTVVIAELP